MISKVFPILLPRRLRLYLKPPLPPVQLVQAQVILAGRSIGRSVGGTPLIAVDLWITYARRAARARLPAGLTDTTQEFTAAGKRNSLTRRFQAERNCSRGEERERERIENARHRFSTRRRRRRRRQRV